MENNKTIVGFHAIKNTDNSITVATSEGITVSQLPYLTTLLEQYDDKQCAVYDLDQFTACLLHAINITKEQGKALLNTGKLFIEGYKITYFPKYFLAISYGQWQGHPEIVFTNMNQDGYLKPVYTEDNSIEDAISKAREARDKAVEVSKAFEYFKLPTNDISSPIKAFLKKYEINWPTVDDCPNEASELAWQAIKGHWFQVNSIGLHRQAYLYDINGSYCWELSKLPDTRKGKFVESKNIPDELTKRNNGVLAITEGTLKTNSIFHPFLTRIDNNNYTPTGKFPTILGIEAIKLIWKYRHLGDYKIDRGYWWIPTEPIQYCYRPRMEWLWNKKADASNNTEKAIATRLYSALWGIQSQYLPKANSFGEHFNSFINYIVEENSRLHVAETCLEKRIMPLAVVGDGFITDSKKYIPTNNNMGYWKLSKQGKCLITGSSSICFESPEPPKGLSLHYNTLMQQIKDNPKAHVYTRAKYSPVTLALALNTDFNKLGNIQKAERSTTIGYSYERIFPDKPETGSDLLNKRYDSIPWDYSVLTTKGSVI